MEEKDLGKPERIDEEAVEEISADVDEVRDTVEYLERQNKRVSEVNENILGKVITV